MKINGLLFHLFNIYLARVGLVVHTWNPRTSEVEAERAGVQGHP